MIAETAVSPNPSNQGGQKKVVVLLEFKGLIPIVGATLVVALNWAGTRPAPTLINTREMMMSP